MRNIGSGRKCALSSSKAPAALRKQTVGCSAKSYRELERKIQGHHNAVKKYLTKKGVHRKAKKFAIKTTARQQSVIKARLKLLTQNFVCVKSIYKCVMTDMIFHISRMNALSDNRKVIMRGRQFVSFEYLVLAEYTKNYM
jgi:hypothetical protein